MNEKQAIESLRIHLPLLAKILKCVVSVFFVHGDPMLKVSAICLEWDKTASPRVVAVRSCLKAPVQANDRFLTQQPSGCRLYSMPPSKILGVGTIGELAEHLGTDKGVEGTKADSITEVSQ